MALYNVRGRISFDAATIVVVCTGCLAALIDADRKGRAPLKNANPARTIAPGQASATITIPQCRKLERDGFLIIDNFLSPEQVRHACASILELDAQNQFQSSPNERDHVSAIDIVKTTDRVLACRAADRPKLDLVRQHIAAFARGLVDSDFGGFDDGNDHLGELHVPAHMQVSICGAAGAASTHDFYHAHLDTAGADRITDLGLLGWLQSRYLRQRYMTCVVYLNEDWSEGDGGCLRLYKRGIDPRTLEKTHFLDVAPLAGRLVVFSSLTQWHTVLPTEATRYACSVWLTMN
jgi:hypothetical protein